MEPGSDFSGYMCVDISGGNAAMAEQLFDRSYILAALQKIGGERVTKRMDRSGLIYAAFMDRHFEGELERANFDVAVLAREEKAGTCAILAVMGPQKLKRPIGKMDIAIFTTLAVTHHENVSLAVNVGCREPYPFRNPQTTGIDDGQCHAIDGIQNELEDALHFTMAECVNDFETLTMRI
jgi:hypothetical protein